MNKNFNKKQRGLSVIEIIIVIFVITVGLITLLNFTNASLKNTILAREVSQANLIVQETIEATRNFRDGTNWNSNGLGILADNINYYPQNNGSLPAAWQLVQGTETIGIFTRKIVFSQVLRNSNDNIVDFDGIIDLKTKKAITTVSWKDKKIEIATYFTNWR